MRANRVRRSVRWLVAAVWVLVRVGTGHAFDVAALQRGGMLRVGTTGDYAPFSVTQADTLAGFDIDLATRLAHDLGARLQQVRVQWPDLASSFENDRVDLVMSGVSIRPERALIGRYSRPYALSGAVALIRSEDRTRFPDRQALDRQGVRIAVNRGGYLEPLARKLFVHATIEPVADNRSLPDRVLRGAADAALTDDLEARAWQRKEFSTVGPFSRDRKAIWIRPDAPQLAKWVDRWLRERERDGWLRALRQRWLGSPMFAAAAADREAVLSDIELRCRMMPMVAATKVAQGLPIEDPAQEQRVLDRVKVLAREVGIEPSEITRLFSSLIRAAKAIQSASGTDPRAFAPSLELLRGAISDLDGHLVRQLRAAARSVKPDEWRAGVREAVQVDNLNDAFKADIAESLAHAHRLVRPASNPPQSKSTPAAHASGS